MAANNKVSGVIKDAADKTALIGVNVTLVESQIHRAKILRDGQIFILRGDKTYTITGIEVK